MSYSIIFLLNLMKSSGSVVKLNARSDRGLVVVKVNSLLPQTNEQYADNINTYKQHLKPNLNLLIYIK